MATRFFLLGTTTNPNKPTAGDKSAVLPVGTDGGDFNQNQDMSITNTTNPFGSGLTYSSLAQTAQQSAMMARFSSVALGAQTVSANTWTIRVNTTEANAAANAFLAASAYIWRPSTSSVVGFIYDSSTTLGAEFPTSSTPYTVTFAGSAVTTQRGDILVLEVWNVATQAMATSYSINFVTSGAGTPVYLETPQNLSFFSNEKTQAFIID